MRTDEERYYDAMQDLSDLICLACRDYKYLLDCEDCGERYCTVCEVHDCLE